MAKYASSRQARYFAAKRKKLAGGYMSKSSKQLDKHRSAAIKDEAKKAVLNGDRLKDNFQRRYPHIFTHASRFTHALNHFEVSLTFRSSGVRRQPFLAHIAGGSSSYTIHLEGKKEDLEELHLADFLDPFSGKPLFLTSNTMTSGADGNSVHKAWTRSAELDVLDPVIQHIWDTYQGLQMSA